MKKSMKNFRLKSEQFSFESRNKNERLKVKILVKYLKLNVVNKL